MASWTLSSGENETRFTCIEVLPFQVFSEEVSGFGYRVQDLGVWVQGAGFRGVGAEFRGWGVLCRV